MNDNFATSQDVQVYVESARLYEILPNVACAVAALAIVLFYFVSDLIQKDKVTATPTRQEVYNLIDVTFLATIAGSIFSVLGFMTGGKLFMRAGFTLSAFSLLIFVCFFIFRAILRSDMEYAKPKRQIEPTFSSDSPKCTFSAIRSAIQPPNLLNAFNGLFESMTGESPTPNLLENLLRIKQLFFPFIRLDDFPTVNPLPTVFAQMYLTHLTGSCNDQNNNVFTYAQIVESLATPVLPTDVQEKLLDCEKATKAAIAAKYDKALTEAEERKKDKAKANIPVQGASQVGNPVVVTAIPLLHVEGQDDQKVEVEVLPIVNEGEGLGHVDQVLPVLDDHKVSVV
jgi:hypothetical protein